MDSAFKKRFYNEKIMWAYSSRMIKDWIEVRHGIEPRHPMDVLSDPAFQGHEWVVVQSLHLVCGHEFYRPPFMGKLSSRD
ncbi:MAG: sirohydrochlorin cobaltochelatase [Deltaproteobacteria bacterium]|nr:sirohydrochlorin cobaltochelatase [Deltaproteobacteria bacterium]